MKILRLVLASSLLLSTPVLADTPVKPAAAVTTGVIQGRVVDPSTHVGIADATVLVSSPALQGTRAEITDEQGGYVIAGLPPGTYEVTCYLPGGGQMSQPGVVVRAGKATLTVFQAGKGVIKKTAKAPSIDSTSAKQGITITPDMTKRIPYAGRTFEGTMGGAAGTQGDSLGVSISGSTSLENDPGTAEQYDHHEPGGFVLAKKDKLSTFAADVDTASYTIVRRKLMEGQVVPRDAVRVEEFVNYFHYGYPAPTAKDRPFEVHVDGAPSPFDRSGHELLRIGVQGKALSKSERKPAHLVFLVDTSGSMQSPDKLPLAQRSLRILVDNLNDGDTVALVTYAGDTRVVLEPTGMDERAKIETAIDDLTAGGGTAMASGIQLAYDLAARTLDRKANTRVIILSDGDANIGTIGTEDILNSIGSQVKKGITLSTVGFGQGNYKDARMEQLADKGNGNAFYIDSLSQAKRVFQEQLGGTLEVIAQDVKLQVELDPAQIASYRLVGYENRDIADQDFKNDKVDAGEIGAGHTVTAIYEVEWAKGRKLDATAQVALVRVRAKQPGGDKASEWSFPVTNAQLASSFTGASADFRFACAVMAFGEILRGSQWAKGWQLANVAAIAQAAAGTAEDRNEFVGLVRKAM